MGGGGGVWGFGGFPLPFCFFCTGQRGTRGGGVTGGTSFRRLGHLVSLGLPAWPEEVRPQPERPPGGLRAGGPHEGCLPRRGELGSRGVVASDSPKPAPRPHGMLFLFIFPSPILVFSPDQNLWQLFFLTRRKNKTWEVCFKQMVSHTSWLPFELRLLFLFICWFWRESNDCLFPFPLLALKGIYHYWTHVHLFSRRL